MGAARSGAGGRGALAEPPAGVGTISAISIGSITQEAYIKASNTDVGDRFGYALAVSGDTLVMGAYREDSAGTGVGAAQYDNDSDNAGAAYVFVRNGTTCSQEACLKASNTDAGDNFGRPVAISGRTLAIGSFPEDSSATGVNGDDADNSSSESGAVYVFDLSVWKDLGGASTGINGSPQLDAHGPLTEGSLMSLALEDAAPSAPCLAWLSFTSAPLEVFGGTLYAYPKSSEYLRFTNAAGVWAQTFPWPGGVPAGTQFRLQFLVQDFSAPSQISISNALTAVSQ